MILNKCDGKTPCFCKAEYTATGVVTDEFDCVSIEVESMERVAMTEDARYREVA